LAFLTNTFLHQVSAGYGIRTGPTGKQPAPERCLEIYDVPAGARLVYGGARIKAYRIEEYDPERPGVVTFINYFELESGRFLRREKVCP
jgi:hypothetical protein